MTPRQCEIAAESYTACLLAQSGFDVLVQYGANQPHYDLVAVKDKRIVPISVKGSQDGGCIRPLQGPRRGRRRSSCQGSQAGSLTPFRFLQTAEGELLKDVAYYSAVRPELSSRLSEPLYAKGGQYLIVVPSEDEAKAPAHARLALRPPHMRQRPVARCRSAVRRTGRRSQRARR